MNPKNNPTRPFDPDSSEYPTHSVKPPAEGPPPGSEYSFLLPPVEADELGRLGNYRVLRLLGSGGMGMVFLAEDIALRRRVALKVMKPDLDHGEGLPWKRFLREAQSMAAIKHDNLVMVFQVGQEGATIYLAMEFLEGESLDAWSRRVVQAETLEIVRVGKELAGGLAAIHKQDLIHRDIKPSNIWLEAPTGRVKILDFGLARSASDDTNLTKSGTILGTPAYMSPEQARGKPGDYRSDLFSFGCVLYRLCTGYEPFRAENTMAQLAALAADTPTPIRELNPAIPEDLAKLVMELLAKDPDKRPESAASVAERLRLLKKQLTGRRRKSQPDATEKLGRPKNDKTKLIEPTTFRRHGWKILLLVGLSILAIVAVIIIVNPFGSDKSGLAKNDKGAGDKKKPAKDGDKVFLTDLKMASFVNWPLPGPKGGKGKKFPDDKKPPKGDRPYERLSVQGKPLPHGLFMHPADEKDVAANVTYNLEKKFSTFHGQVTLNDSAPPDPTPITLTVYGDGKLLWKSQPIANQNAPQKCEISVKNVSVLKLEATASGDIGGAHAVWMEPYLVK